MDEKDDPKNGGILFFLNSVSSVELKTRQPIWAKVEKRLEQ